MPAQADIDQPRQARRRRCVVHIGLNKTGSTTIQGWLGANRDQLAEQGIRYDTLADAGPRTLPHALGFSAIGVHRAGRLLPNPDARLNFGIETLEDQAAPMAEFEARAEASINAPGYRTYVISSEFLPAWLRKPEWTRLFHDWLTLRFDKVRYVVYLRDQISWVPSAFAQMIKMGGVYSMEEFLERKEDRDYFKTCARWRRGTPNSRLTVRLLEADSLINGDLIEDFANLIGASTENTRAPKTLNESIDAASLEPLRQINLLADKFPEKWTRAVRSGHVQKMIGSSTGKKLTLTRAQALGVARRNAASNEKLRKRFFPERPVLFARSHALLTQSQEDAD